MNDLSDSIERLIDRIESIERRVAALERNRGASPAPVPPAHPHGTAAPAPDPQESGIFSILGQAMLAVAGAYLLRALAESSTIPRLPLLALSIVYAFLWLVPAARAKARLPSIAWALTSAIILLPMLWELTLRFHFLPDATAAAVLAGFVIAASALGWNRHFAEIAWVAGSAACLAAVALAFAAHDILPFLAALFVAAAAAEFAAARHRTLRVRPLIAAAADFLVFALIWIYSSPASSRAEYPAIGAGHFLALALLLIYAGSASTQALLLGRRISFFETAQTLVAFLLNVWGLLVFWSGPGERLLGILCLAASVAGYAVAFARFDRSTSQRNFHVYSSGSVALLLAGCWLCLPTPWLPVVLTLFAIAAAVIGVWAARATIEFHGFAFLLAAAYSSGLLIWAFHALAGSFPAPPSWRMDCVAAASTFGYVAARGADGGRPIRALRLLQAGLALSAAAALLVWGLVSVTAGAAPAPQHLAVARTLIGCALTVLLAFAGARRRRRELVWLAWTSLACIAAKLLFEDLRHGHLGFTAASIFVYAVTLLVVPRLVHIGQGVEHPG